jgi:bisanhydrobacterioruberin hydratase
MHADWFIKTIHKTGTINRTLTATVLAMVIHLAGALGMLFGRRDWFLMLTPFNLLFMFFLLIWTLPEKNNRLYGFFTLAFFIGLFTEMVGVKTGWLFGNYHYGEVLGFKINQAPLIIGINWFIIVYASGMMARQLMNFISQRFQFQQRTVNSKWISSVVIIGGAFIATVFDVIMEPAAVKLGFWTWENGNIPIMNYVSWFLVSGIILFIFRHASFKTHQFAINLLIIQALFFLVLR